VVHIAARLSTAAPNPGTLAQLQERGNNQEAARLRVLILNSRASDGKPARGLPLYLASAAEQIDAHVVMADASEMYASLVGATVYTVPELIERVRMPPWRWARRSRMPLLRSALGIASLAVAALKVIRLSRRLRPNLIYCNHALATPIGRIVGWLLRIPVTVHTRDLHERFVDLERLDRRGVTPRLRRELGLARDAQVIGYVGKVVPSSGIDRLVRAFARVAPLCPRVVLVVVGGNDASLKRDLLKEYRRLAEQLGVADRARFIGFRQDTRPYLADFDLLALPAAEPGHCQRVLIEAMALGVPAVLHAGGPAADVVRDGVEGVWTRHNDVEDMAEKLTALLRDDARRRALSQSAAASARERYDKSKLSLELTALLHSAARGEFPAASPSLIRASAPPEACAGRARMPWR
jgi:glycosyltransferase involved in cell wall biosynthesis